MFEQCCKAHLDVAEVTRAVVDLASRIRVHARLARGAQIARAQARVVQTVPHWKSSCVGERLGDFNDGHRFLQ